MLHFTPAPSNEKKNSICCLTVPSYRGVLLNPHQQSIAKSAIKAMGSFVLAPFERTKTIDVIIIEV